MKKFNVLWDLKEGYIACEGSTVGFHIEGSEAVTVSLHELRVKVTGQNNHFVQVSHPAFAGANVVVTDEEFLSYLQAHRHKQASASRSDRDSRRRKLFWIRAIPVIAIAFLIFVLPVLLYFAPTGLINLFVSVDKEIEIRKSIEKRLGSTTAASNQELKLTQLAQELKKHSPLLDRFEIKVHVSTSPEINAFALPGGLLVFNMGLISAAENLDEVLGVMGHELGHVALRHTTKAMVNGFGMTAGFLILSIFVGGDVSSALMHGTDLMQLSYSRHHELDADAFSAKLLYDSGIKITGFKTFFDRIRKIEQVHPLAKLTLLSTHPSSDERTHKIDEFIRQYGEPKVEWKSPVTLKELRQ